jgi:hypothetical protein
VKKRPIADRSTRTLCRQVNAAREIGATGKSAASWSELNPSVVTEPTFFDPLDQRDGLPAAFDRLREIGDYFRRQPDNSRSSSRRADADAYSWRATTTTIPCKPQVSPMSWANLTQTPETSWNIFT